MCGRSGHIVAVRERIKLPAVEQAHRQAVSYDPNRLEGVNAYKEAAHEIATGNRIQFTARDKYLGVATERR